MPLDRRQVAKLGVHFRQASPYEGPRVPTRALTPVLYVEKFLDICQPKPHSLGAADEPKSLSRRFVVKAVAGGSPPGGTKQTQALVVAESVRAHPETVGQHGDGRLRHITTIDLGVDSKVKAWPNKTITAASSATDES